MNYTCVNEVIFIKRDKMKIGRKFNQLSKSEYAHYIQNHKKYTDFNTLGLYCSILENRKLSLEDKIEIRDLANTLFGKFFNFLQLKDPSTYFDLITLGQELTTGDTNKIWDDISRNQEKILADKKIKHRNFGVYSKHSCSYDGCRLNGLMIKQGSWFAERNMWFKSDKNKCSLKNKSRKRKKQRKNAHQIIQNELESQ